MERDTEVVRTEKAGRTMVRIGNLVVMCDLDKSYRYQIVTNPHRNHPASGSDVDSIVPHELSLLSEVRYFNITCGILARMG